MVMVHGIITAHPIPLISPLQTVQSSLFSEHNNKINLEISIFLLPICTTEHP